MIRGVTDRAVDLVGEGIDCTLRIGELPDSTLIARPIAMATVVTCAALEYLHEHGEPQTLDDLASHRGVNFLSGQSNRTLPWHFSIKGQDRAFESNAGITVAEHLDSVSLVEILRRHRPAPRPVALRYPSRAHWALAAGSRLLSVVRGSHRPKAVIPLFFETVAIQSPAGL